MSYWENTGKYQQWYDYLYKELVPASGNADTAEGELLRAVSKAMYRYYNDGDSYHRFYVDYSHMYNLGSYSLDDFDPTSDEGYNDMVDRAVEMVAESLGYDLLEPVPAPPTPTMHECRNCGKAYKKKKNKKILAKIAKIEEQLQELKSMINC